MTVSLFDSALYGPLFSDDAAAALFSDAAQVRAMSDVEAALARAEAAAGVIPADAADAISRAVADGVSLDPARLGDGTREAGLPVPAFVKALRAAVGGDAAQYVHWGATSHDILDTALMLRLRDLLDLYETRLDDVIGGLARVADAERATVMAGRTRWQQAAPTTFGLKAAGWAMPLIRHRARLAELRPRLLVLQFGGAVGSLSALGDKGVAVMEGLAAELGLGVPPMPWHAQRDGLVEFAGWLSLVTGSLGKIGEDLALLAQSEVAEAHAGPRGGSSTMPQKANPVVAETLVALARFNAGQAGVLHQVAIQEHERGGAGWSAEWLTLPQMAVAAAAALRHGVTAVETLALDRDRMRRNLEASNGLILAEAAVFALAAHMPRPEAQDLVKAACATASSSGRHLMDVLGEATGAQVDWAALRDPANYLGAADEFIDRVLAHVSKKT